MVDVIEILKKNSNKILKSEGEDISSLKVLQHTISDLRKLLKISILDIEIQNGRRYICTANEELVKKFAPIKENQSFSERNKTSIFNSNDGNIALAFDLLHNKYITIIGNRWHIFNFLTIKEENVELLHSLMVEILRKPL